MLVRQVMDDTPALCVPFDSVKDAATIMKRNQVAFIPVVENEPTHMYVGAVTDRSLCHNVIARGLDSERTQVSEVVEYRRAFCRPDDPVEKAVATMRRQHLNNLAVLDDERQVVGIVSIDDIVPYALTDGGRKAKSTGGGRGRKPQGSPGTARGSRGGTARARQVRAMDPVKKGTRR